MTAPRPPGTRVALAVAAAVALAVVLTRVAQAQFMYIAWTDRDLWRAARLWQDLPTAGAELNYGGGARIPGGASYVLLWLGLLPRGAPVDAFRLMLVLEAAGAAAIAAAGTRLRGPLAGVLAALVFVGPNTTREALKWLWNPSAVPGFVGLGTLLVVWVAFRGSRAAWAAWAAVLAVGAQFHMTVAGWLAWSGLALVLSRPREALARLPWIAAALFVVELPYLLGELASGFANTRLLLAQGPVETVTTGSTLTFDTDELGRAAAMVVPRSLPEPEQWPVAVPELGALLGVVALVAALGAVVREPAGPTRTALRAIALPTVALLLTPALDAHIHLEWRYVLATLPGVALLAGVGLSDLVALATRAHRALGGAALAVVTLLAVAHPAGLLAFLLSGDHGYGSLYTWEGQARWRAAVQEATGWDLQELAGRAGVVTWDERSRTYRWLAATPIDYPMLQAGTAFDGSRPSPCVALIEPAHDGPPPDLETLAWLTQVPAEQLVLRTRLEAAPGLVALIYELPDGWCPTTLVDRYVWTPEDHLLHPLWEQVGPGEVVPLPAPEGETRRVVRLTAHPPPKSSEGDVLLGVWLRPTPGHVDVELHSSQLRGGAFNGGWYQTGMLGHLDLIATPADGGPPLTTRLVDRPLGATYVATPLRDLGVDLPSGTHALDLEVDVHDTEGIVGRWPPHDQPSRRVRVRLVDALVVP